MYMVEDGTGGDSVDSLEESTPELTEIMLEGRALDIEEVVVAGVGECEVVSDPTDCTLACPSVVMSLSPDGHPVDVVATVGCARRDVNRVGVVSLADEDGTSFSGPKSEASHSRQDTTLGDAGSSGHTVGDRIVQWRDEHAAWITDQHIIEFIEPGS